MAYFSAPAAIQTVLQSAQLGISSKSCGGHNSPLTTNLYITRHATLNPIACMCQTMCDVTSSNVLGRLVQCEHRLSMVWAQRVGQGEMGWYVHPIKGWKQHDYVWVWL